MSSGERVGFVGLGMMGWPMASNLAAAGYSLTVRDVDVTRQERFTREHGGVAAAAPPDFDGVGTVITMLPDDGVVRDAVLNWDGGIAVALAPGALVIDMSSSNPRGTRALGEALAQRGIGLLDAPVSGGAPGAQSGTLSIMIGGDDDALVERATPILGTLGKALFRTGPLGSGHAMKALNNFIAAAAYTATAEALAIGLRYGLEPETMIDIINASSGHSMVSELVFKKQVVTGQYAAGFTLGLLAKDVAIAGDLASTSGVDAPACHLVGDRYADALAALGAQSDHSAAHKRWWCADFSGAGTTATAPGAGA